MATCHPQLQGWVGGKPLLLVLNRVDMVSDADQAAWGAYFRQRQQPTYWTDAKLGTGVRKVTAWSWHIVGGSSMLPVKGQLRHNLDSRQRFMVFWVARTGGQGSSCGRRWHQRGTASAGPAASASESCRGESCPIESITYCGHPAPMSRAAEAVEGNQVDPLAPPAHHISGARVPHGRSASRTWARARSSTGCWGARWRRRRPAPASPGSCAGCGSAAM
jgi:hypothetical protein